MNDMILAVVKAIIIIGGMGLLFGALLGGAAKLFEVRTDERMPQILEVLPGANCGGCGFAGCSAYASALCGGGVKTNLCPVGGSEVAAKVSDILGVNAEEKEKTVARVMCCGNFENSSVKYTFEGIPDCYSAVRLGGGNKMCEYACLGLGSCVSVCAFGALSVKNGIAAVDTDKCCACGLCVMECPKNIIKIVPAKSKYAVLCNSKAKGKEVRQNCNVGCIGCGICAKNCPKEAITIENSLAVIDYEKCVGCGVCATKCPQKSIVITV